MTLSLLTDVHLEKNISNIIESIIIIIIILSIADILLTSILLLLLLLYGSTGYQNTQVYAILNS